MPAKYTEYHRADRQRYAEFFKFHDMFISIVCCYERVRQNALGYLLACVYGAFYSYLET